MGKVAFLKRFGKDITIKIRKRDGEIVYLDFKCPELVKSPMLFLGHAEFSDPLSVKDWKIATISAFGQPCANCGEEENIEMHHVKHIKTLNVKLEPFDKMLAKINRKQVPLCRACHNKVHNGKYQGMSIKFFHHIK